jgi:hypothetical protein
VFAEVAYYRLVFLEGTSAELGEVETELTAFRAQVGTDRGVDLTAPPFAAREPVLASPSRYEETQALGEAMRAARVEAFRYRSARDSRGGINVAVLDASAFGRRRPRGFENWHCIASRQRVEVISRGWFGRGVHAFAREEFLVAGELPSPAV